MLTGHSLMAGGITFLLGTRVKLHSFHLSYSLPDFVPQKSTESKISTVGKFTTNSPEFFRISYEYRSGRTPIETIGGSEQQVLAHERVIIDSIDLCLTEVSTTGLG